MPTTAPRDAPPNEHGITRRTLAWLAATGVMSIGVEPVRGLVPVYVVREAGYDAAFTSALFVALFLLTAVGSVVGGFAADAIGHRRAYLIGMAGRLALGGMFLTTEPAWLFALFAIQGLAWGWGDSTLQSFVIQAISPRRTGTVMGLWFSAMGFAALAGNAVAAGVVGSLGFRPIGVLGIVTAGIGYALIWLTMPRASERRSLTAPSTGVELESSNRRLLRDPSALRFWSVTALPTVYFGVAAVAVPLLLYEATQSAAVVAGFGLARSLNAVVLQPIWGRMADGQGVWRPLFVAMGLLAAGSAGVALTPHVAGAVFAGAILGAIGMGVRDTLAPTIARLVIPPVWHGRAMGIASMSWSLAALLGALAGGPLIGIAPAAPFWLVAALALLTMLPLWSLRRVAARRGVP